MMMAASAQHMIFRPKDKVKLKQLVKRMADYIYHVWQWDQEAFDCILHVCMDYKEGRLYMNREEENK